MSNLVAAKPIEYRDLIKEVYIDPIRTVVVIDDQFPTLDGLIAGKWPERNTESENIENAEKVKEILAICRHNDRRWMVDVHDGKTNNDQCIASHLHQTDLMILDYHLDGNDGNGDKAIEIIRELADNDHFNMVIVYTKGYGIDTGDIDRVVTEIALGLTCSNESPPFTSEKEKNIISQLNEWDDEEDGFSEQLKSEISDQVFLSYRLNPENFCNQPEVRNIQDKLGQKTISSNLNIIEDEMIQWLLWGKQKAIQTKLSNSDLGQVLTASPGADVNWIRTDRLFVTVINKKHQPNELPNKLLDALNAWCPEPHRLLMGKMRFLMNDRGVIAESEVLGNRYIQVGWLQKLLEPKSHAQNQTINNTITRHWEALGDVLKKDIKSFADRLVEHLTSQTKSLVMQTHSKIDVNDGTEKENIAKYINCYKSTKPVDGFHLTTGHILEMDVGSDKEYWICLSPACDLVPKEKPKGLALRVNNSMPFTAVQLEKTTIKKAVKDVTHNIFLFLKIGNEIEAFTFHPNGDTKTNPVWEQLIAGESGKFELEEKKLQIWRPSGFNEDCMLTTKHTAYVVAQLQYEYALNLLQRFGATMSRVGLDFSKHN